MDRTLRNALASLPLALLAVFPALMLAGCQKEVVARPTILLVSPLDGSTLDTSSIIVEIAVERFTLTTDELDPPTTEGDRTGEPFFGHWHLYFDLQFTGEQFAEAAVLTGLPPGSHSIIAELVNQNHFPVLGTPLAESIIEIPEDRKLVYITSPPPGSSFPSSSVELALDIENFVLDSAGMGQPNVPGHGHIHLYVDTISDATLRGEFARTNPILTDLAGGIGFDVIVSLANNDHTLLSPAVFDGIPLAHDSSGPRVTLVEPLAEATVSSTFGVKIQVENFTLVDFGSVAVDTNNKAGHYHVLVDGADIGHAFTTSAGGFSASPGKHEVRVELRSNLHVPLPPPVVDLAGGVVVN